MDLSIIIPCYNEEQVIYQSYEKLKSVLDKYPQEYEIVFVNDGSTDQTLRELNRVKAENKRVNIISYTPNKGPGFACRTLYAVAQGDVVIQMDADLSMDPEETIPLFLEEIKKCDTVIGSRYVGITPDYPLRRRIPSRMYHALNKVLFNLPIRDTQSGFFAFRKQALKSVQCHANGFEIHVELFARLKKAGWKLKEVPLKFRHQTESGETSVLKNGPKMLLNTLKVWKQMRQEKV